jgi:hypothetical protein
MVTMITPVTFLAQEIQVETLGVFVSGECRSVFIEHARKNYRASMVLVDEIMVQRQMALTTTLAGVWNGERRDPTVGRNFCALLRRHLHRK